MCFLSITWQHNALWPSPSWRMPFYSSNNILSAAFNVVAPQQPGQYLSVCIFKLSISGGAQLIDLLFYRE